LQGDQSHFLYQVVKVSLLKDSPINDEHILGIVSVEPQGGRVTVTASVVVSGGKRGEMAASVAMCRHHFRYWVSLVPWLQYFNRWLCLDSVPEALFVCRLLGHLVSLVPAMAHSYQQLSWQTISGILLKRYSCAGTYGIAEEHTHISKG
jgi:hypothetical protein